MPGKKDSVSMLVNGIKQQVQKRLILFTEYEAFLQFKKCNPEVKIGFSKFAEARPKNVVLPGSAGTHNVCVCTYQQNPKLMIRNSQISSRPEFKRIAVQKGESYEGEIKYQHLVARIMCNPPSEDCWVSYKQWESTDRTELVTVTENTQEFVTNLVAKLQVLKVHMFIHDMQTKFFHQVKNNLSHGQVLAVGDFSENYSFVTQDAAQGVHWSNTSCTLHPWICYYNQDNEIKTFSVLFISDCLNHDTVAVYAFQTVLIKLLKAKIDLQSIQYFSDGCAKQYKNKKNFLNLAHHFSDFAVHANWSFSATSHGKGPWDGLAGSVKREAGLESLRRPLENQILTADALYQFAKDKFTNVSVEFVTSEMIENLYTEVLEKRFEQAKTIKGTLGFHSYSPLPGCCDTVSVKQYDLSSDKKDVSITKTKK